MSDISLILKDGTACPLFLLNDSWGGTTLTEITVNDDGSSTSSIGLEYIKQYGSSLLDILAVGEKHGVDVMVGEFCFFENGDPMVAGINQEATEKMFLDQIETFENTLLHGVLSTLEDMLWQLLHLILLGLSTRIWTIVLTMSIWKWMRSSERFWLNRIVLP